MQKINFFYINMKKHKYITLKNKKHKNKKNLHTMYA